MTILTNVWWRPSRKLVFKEQMNPIGTLCGRFLKKTRLRNWIHFRNTTISPDVGISGGKISCGVAWIVSEGSSRRTLSSFRIHIYSAMKGTGIDSALRERKLVKINFGYANQLIKHVGEVWKLSRKQRKSNGKLTESSANTLRILISSMGLNMIWDCMFSWPPMIHWESTSTKKD